VDGTLAVVEVEAELPGSTTLQQARQLGRQAETALREAVREVRIVRWIARPWPAAGESDRRDGPPTPASLPLNPAGARQASSPHIESIAADPLDA